jgi:DNA replication and repair protein RecF
MFLKELKLTDYRNYARLQLSFGEGIQIIHGENGQGKTNLLESIYYLAITKSFRMAKEKEILRQDQPYFEIVGEFAGRENPFTVRTYWDRENKKNFWMNSSKVNGLQDYIGTIPIVLLIPSDLAITKGAPGERRRFFDLLLGQAQGKYLKNLVHYKKLLKNRSLILLEENPDKTLFESYTHKMAEIADELCQERLLLVNWLNEKLEETYSRISGKTDKVYLDYKPSFSEYGDTGTSFASQWPLLIEKELLRKRTLIGPHLDDFVMYLNDKPIRQFGSQGENKTAVIALKLSEYFYLYDQTHERPLMLFDDIFGELDENRINNMLNALGEIAQVFVTTTSPDFFNKLDIKAHIDYYRVENGKIED